MAQNSGFDYQPWNMAMARTFRAAVTAKGNRLRDTVVSTNYRYTIARQKAMLQTRKSSDYQALVDSTQPATYGPTRVVHTLARRNTAIMGSDSKSNEFFLGQCVGQIRNPCTDCVNRSHDDIHLDPPRFKDCVTVTINIGTPNSQMLYQGACMNCMIRGAAQASNCSLRSQPVPATFRPWQLANYRPQTPASGNAVTPTPASGNTVHRPPASGNAAGIPQVPGTTQSSVVGQTPGQSGIVIHDLSGLNSTDDSSVTDDVVVVRSSTRVQGDNPIGGQNSQPQQPTGTSRPAWLQTNWNGLKRDRDTDIDDADQSINGQPGQNGRNVRTRLDDNPPDGRPVLGNNGSLASIVPNQGQGVTMSLRDIIRNTGAPGSGTIGTGDTPAASAQDAPATDRPPHRPDQAAAVNTNTQGIGDVGATRIPTSPSRNPRPQTQPPAVPTAAYPDLGFMDNALIHENGDAGTRIRLPPVSYRNPIAEPSMLHTVLYDMVAAVDNRAYQGLSMGGAMAQRLGGVLSTTNDVAGHIGVVLGAQREMAQTATDNGQDPSRWVQALFWTTAGSVLAQDIHVDAMEDMLHQFRDGFGDGDATDARLEDLMGGLLQVTHTDLSTMLHHRRRTGWMNGNMLFACLTAFVVRRWHNLGRGDVTTLPSIIRWEDFRQISINSLSRRPLQIPTGHTGDIYLIVNASHNHWYLTVLRRRTREIFVLDSISDDARRRLGHAYANTILRELQLDPTQWRLVSDTQSEQQVDAWSCGTFVLENARLMIETGTPLVLPLGVTLTLADRVPWMRCVFEVIRLSRQLPTQGWRGIPNPHPGLGIRDYAAARTPGSGRTDDPFRVDG